MKKEFILEGLTCSNCASKIEQALNKVEYVSNANVNLITTTLKLFGV